MGVVVGYAARESRARPTLARNVIDIVARFGKHPDVDEVDAHVRSVMQTALDRFGRQRRQPVMG